MNFYRELESTLRVAETEKKNQVNFALRKETTKAKRQNSLSKNIAWKLGKVARIRKV